MSSFNIIVIIIFKIFLFKNIKKSKFFFLNNTFETKNKQTLRVFDSVVAVVFQITFRAEMHANDVFLFFKNYF